MAFVLKYFDNPEESWYSTKKECIADFARVASVIDVRGKCLATIHRGYIKNGKFVFDENPLFKLSIGNQGNIRCVSA
jgi:hypothetical protein